MRANSDMRSPPPPPLHGFAEYFPTRDTMPVWVPVQQETDAACWERMLALQKEYHCYKSARLEAAVEALESGCSIDEVPMREYGLIRYDVDTLTGWMGLASRLCLDLLNDELKAMIEAHQVGLIP
jgi:hypothetical protein